VTLVEKLKSKEQVDFNSYQVENFLVMYHYFVKIKWCKYTSEYDIQLERLMRAIKSFDSKRKSIISDIVNKSKGLRMYLIIHSIFPINTNKKKSEEGEEYVGWFTKLMAKLLQPSEEEIKSMHEYAPIPDDVLNSVSIFEPKRLTNFDILFDDKIISYKLWGDTSKDESYQPITFIDRRWDNIGLDRKARIKNKEFISKFKIIQAIYD